MNGLETTTMTSEEMRSRRARGESQTDWIRLKREQAADVEPLADDESPDATVALQEMAACHRVGRPVGSGSKEQVAIRIDREVLTAFRATGAGWQTWMNDALKDWLKTHSPA